jgi:lipoprotein-anchoring transpeptidase ErfK/SrfK
MRRGWSVVFTALFALVLVLTSCSGDKQARSGPVPVPAKSAAPLSLTLAPVPGAGGVPASAEITTTVRNGYVAKVTMVDSRGAVVPGALRPDGSSWVPAQPLAYGTGYRVTVSAVGPDNQVTSAATNFTTMADPGSSRIGTGLYLQEGAVYGVGMPVVVEFDEPIPAAAKASVERRLFVDSQPRQVGVWHWYGDRQVLFRPREYWQPGTVLTVRAALGGLPVGNRFVDVDRSARSTIGPAQSLLIKDQTKTLYVYDSGQLVKSFPVSLGKPSTPTSSGNFVLMSHEASTRFKTPEYSLTAYWAERFTWGGQFLHSAPWSVGEQGSTNVSHGCVNLSNGNAEWIYEHSRIGDPLTIEGTGTHLSPGDGWTVWDISWDEYLKGSALPHPELAAGTAAPATTGSAAASSPATK